MCACVCVCWTCCAARTLRTSTPASTLSPRQAASAQQAGTQKTPRKDPEGSQKAPRRRPKKTPETHPKHPQKAPRSSPEDPRNAPQTYKRIPRRYAPKCFLDRSSLKLERHGEDFARPHQALPQAPRFFCFLFFCSLLRAVVRRRLKWNDTEKILHGPLAQT